ncbi:heme transporter FLVCR1-like isoform X2 [Euwallacea fornicatus]|uniref:heme transporter FLVCR1-like isoform X2 n=1 Tax=Euwallacea fornicatus TaxID=995702 RepID=UPI00338DA60A
MPPQSLSNSQFVSTGEIVVFTYRWIILFLYGLVALTNFMQVLQFSIISNIITQFYNVDNILVDLSCIIFFISFIIFFYPVSFIVEKYNLKLTVVSAMALTLAGNLIKLFAAQSDRYWVVLLAQLPIAIGQVQLASIASKLATTWFGPEEVSTACAIAVLWMQLVFKPKPNLPPSQSQLNLIVNADENRPSFLANIREVIKNRNFWFVVMSMGLANGLWNSFGVVFNTIYLNYFPNGESDAGVIALLSIISGGCIGSIVVGIILDKTHQFKKVSFAILLLAAISYGFVSISLIAQSKIAIFITVPIFGFFIAPSLIVGFEFLVEITYPIPEACSSSTFNAAYCFQSIVSAILLEVLFESIGYVWTFVIIFFTMCCCAMFVLLVNTELRRRDANLQHNHTVIVDTGGAVPSISNSSRSSSSSSMNEHKNTIVTIAKF